MTPAHQPQMSIADRLTPFLTPDQRSHIESRVDESGDNPIAKPGCALWTGAITVSGAPVCGATVVDPETGISHRLTLNPARVVWLLVRGPIEPGRKITGGCGNHHCIAPRHLVIVGEQRRKVYEMKEYQRQRKRVKNLETLRHAAEVLDQTRERAHRMYKGTVLDENVRPPDPDRPPRPPSRPSDDQLSALKQKYTPAERVPPVIRDIFSPITGKPL